MAMISVLEGDNKKSVELFYDAYNHFNKISYEDKAIESLSSLTQILKDLSFTNEALKMEKKILEYYKVNNNLSEVIVSLTTIGHMINRPIKWRSYFDDILTTQTGCIINPVSRYQAYTSTDEKRCLSI